MIKKLTIILVLFLATIFLFGCISDEIELEDLNQSIDLNEQIINEVIVKEPNELEVFPFTTENLFNIVKTDSDFSEFNEIHPNFQPKLVNYVPVTKNGFEQIKKAWQETDKEIYIGIIENLELTNSTYFVEFVSKNNSNQFLISIMDIKNNNSLKIISRIKMEMDGIL
jgi:hypothetical protein